MNKANQYLTMYQELLEEIEKIVDILCKYRSAVSPDIERCDVKITPTHVEVEWTIPAGCSCCGEDYWCEEFPTEYLFNETWIFDFEQKENESLMKQIKEREQKKTEQEEQDRKGRLKQFNKLKEEFGNE